MLSASAFNLDKTKTLSSSKELISATNAGYSRFGSGPRLAQNVKYGYVIPVGNTNSTKHVHSKKENVSKQNIKIGKIVLPFPRRKFQTNPK